MKELLKQIDEELFEWGEWVGRESVNKPIKPPSMPTQDETRFKARRRRFVQSETLTIKYKDNQPVSAHYGKDNVVIPIQEITMPKSYRSINIPLSEPKDDLFMNIDRYFVALKISNPELWKFTKCRWRWGWTREEIMKDLRMSKRKHDSSRITICSYIYECKITQINGNNLQYAGQQL